MTYKQINDSTLATVGGRIRAIRLAKGMTTEVCAKKLKVSRPTVTQWETGAIEVVPDHRIEAFAKLMNVSPEWIAHHKGKKPDIDFSSIPRRGKKNDDIIVGTIATSPSTVPAQVGLPSADIEVLEIKPKLSAHAKSLDMSPQAKWSIPREVLTLGFNCDPDQSIIKRVLVDGPALDGMPVRRGDYVLIDATRTIINEAGLYYVADPEGREVQNVIASIGSNGTLTVISQRGEPVDHGDLEVLGRAMAVFHAI